LRWERCRELKKARETDGGSAVKTTKMDTKLVVAGEAGVEIVNRGKSDESSKERRKRRKKRRKLNSRDAENGRVFDEPLDRVCFLFDCD
jgi:hypothetical protein